MKRTLLALLASAALSCAGRIENLHDVVPGVLAGAAPRGEEAFRELAARGVKTLISVDGAKPDVEAARRHGLRYVHLPVGYDGIPERRGLELAKALRELEGPVYLHCHHGRHRVAAATAVACVAAGKLDTEGALRLMRSMGTDEGYRGLWASAREAKPADTAALEVTFREIAPVPPLQESMVALDAALEVDALRAREILAELQRTEDFAARPADYRAWMKASEDAAAALPEGVERLRKSCVDCHKAYRNTPKER